MRFYLSPPRHATPLAHQIPGALEGLSPKGHVHARPRPFDKTELIRLIPRKTTKPVTDIAGRAAWQGGLNVLVPYGHLPCGNRLIKDPTNPIVCSSRRLHGSYQRQNCQAASLPSSNVRIDKLVADGCVHTQSPSPLIVTRLTVHCLSQVDQLKPNVHARTFFPSAGKGQTPRHKARDIHRGLSPHPDPSWASVRAKADNRQDMPD